MKKLLAGIALGLVCLALNEITLGIPGQITGILIFAVGFAGGAKCVR